MTMSLPPDMKAFLDGGVRDAMGFTSEELRFGLTMAKREMDRGDFAEALKTYTSLVACEPMTIDYQVGLANCAARMERYDLALDAATAAMGLAPRDPRGWLISGRCCIALGRREQAKQDLETAASLGLAARDAAIVAEARRLLSALAA